MDKISVIIPVYKVEEYIHQCMESILFQTYPNLEIILVDDGSPDNCGKICDDYAAKDSRIIVIHKENGGAPAARNDALAIATGKWIAYVDPDDWLELNEFEEVMKNAENEEPDIIIFNSYTEKSGSQNMRQNFSSDFTTEDASIIRKLQLAALDEHFAPFNQISNQSYPWDKVFRRSMLASHNVLWPVNLKANDDLVFVAQAYQFTKKVSYINKALYHYRLDPGSVSITQKYTPNRPQIDHDVYVELINLKDKYGLGEEYSEALYGRIILNTWNCCRRCFFNPDNKKSFLKKMQMISETLHNDIVKTAFQKVNRSKLDRTQKMMTFFKNPRPIWIFIVYRAHNLKHRLFHDKT